jgi:NADPH-dependent curcumin reductase CurA
MAPIPKTTRQWLLASKPTDMPVLSGSNQTFRLENTPIPAVKDGQVLMKSLYYSNDPAQRGWISRDIKPGRLYRPPVNEGDVMSAGGLYEVVESKAETLKPGTIVLGYVGWTEYAVADAKVLTPVSTDALPEGLGVTQYLGAFGGTGMTAYYGLLEVAEAKKEDVVVVSGAAGATGSMVVQIAKKMVGCKKVIGIAGGAAKCKWVVEELGADVCVDYKSGDFEANLAKETGGDAGNVDVYFDNVGGEILDFMLTRMALFGRIAACGAISGYNTALEKTAGLKNWFEVISMRIQIKGFIVLDFRARKGAREECIGYLIQGVKEGKLKIGKESEQVVKTKFEDVPKTWVKLFEGANTGKLVTEVV